MTFPLANDLRGEPVRPPPRLGIAARLQIAWRHICRRARTGTEAFLASAVPPPHMVFPDSGSPLAQFPTLSSMVMLRGRAYPLVWEEPSDASAAYVAEYGRLRKGVGLENKRAESPVAEPEVVRAGKPRD